MTLDEPLHLSCAPDVSTVEGRDGFGGHCWVQHILLSIIVDDDYRFGINPTSLVRVSFLSGSSNLIDDLSCALLEGFPPEP